MSDTFPSTALPKLDRWFWLIIIIATVVLVVRGALIMREHSEIMDSEFHLRSGVALLTGNPGEIRDQANDAPLGQMVMALPVVLSGQTPDKPINDATWPASVARPGEGADAQRAKVARTIRRASLYGNRWSPRTILIVVAVWKSLLFVPAIGVIFQWCRAIYGLRSALLASAMVLTDPTFAAHIPIIALDTLGVEGIVIACFCIWRYFEAPGTRRLITASIAMALAVMLKHTAVIVPGVACAFALYYWFQRDCDWRKKLRPRLNIALLAMIVFLTALWALTGFDISSPSKHFVNNNAIPALDHNWPGGVYIGRFVSGFFTSSGGHYAYLWGNTKMNGWWYYFPALATYKVPIGICIVLLLGVASFALVRWRREEICTVIPMLAWSALLTTSHLNIGFRHFLPAYVFMLMFASRCVAGGAKWVRPIAWAGVIVAAVHVTSFHPDYLSYFNIPRRHWWLHISESNVDWGQALRQTARWLDAHPQRDRDVYFAPRWNRSPVSVGYYLDERVRLLDRGNTPPDHGLLIVSPIWVSGVYDDGKNPYEFLHALEPIDVIGHALLVYDLDAKLKKHE